MSYILPKSLRLEDGTCRGRMHLREKDNLPCLLNEKYIDGSCQTCPIRELYIHHIASQNPEIRKVIELERKQSFIQAD